jgi:hypothetical protein
MINLEQYLYEKVKPIMESWDESGIYAISFLVYANGAYFYNNCSNVSEFAISYNTEGDFEKSASFASANEARWNYAFWRQNTTHIIDPNENFNEGMKILFDWYAENNITNIGEYSNDNQFDEQGVYIGKGAGGYFELLTAVSNVARRLQTEGFVAGKFGAVPIIVHELEYHHLVESATRNANPNGEAEGFLMALANYFE